MTGLDTLFSHADTADAFLRSPASSDCDARDEG